MSPKRTVTEILAEKRAAFEALMATADGLHGSLLERSIDVSQPDVGKTGSGMRLPLAYFDNTDLERNTPQGWVTASRRTYGKRPNAILLLPNGSEAGGGAWFPGRVHGYDVSAGAFSACPAGVDGRILEDRALKLTRLSVMFLSERVDEFASRVADAHRMRDECEAALLLRFYIKNMPTADVRTLNELQVARLLERSLSTTRLKAADIDPNDLIEEVKLDYAQSVNGARPAAQATAQAAAQVAETGR